MKKSIRIAYYVSTVILSLAFLYGGYSEIIRDQASVELMVHLGYPFYLLTILGVAKILAVIGIWQKFSPALREWAYAGIVIDIVGAVVSMIAVGDKLPMIIPAVIALAITLTSYFSWKKMARASTQTVTA